MGFTSVKARLCNAADLEKSEEVELLVDTGAIFSSAPRSLLEKIGLKPIARRKVRVYAGGKSSNATSV